jgi:hypothetical protein
MPTIWSKPANARVNELHKVFKEDLRTIAGCLARHDKAVSVSPSHVHRAFESLANAGLARRRWIDRPDAETAIGGTFVGGAFAAPDAVNTLFDPSSHPGIAAGALIASFVIGTFLVIHGTFRAKLPVPAQETSQVQIWIRRILLIAVGVGIVSAMIYLALSMFSATAASGPPSLP